MQRKRPIRNPTASVTSPVTVHQAMMSLPVHLSLMVRVFWSYYLDLARSEAGWVFFSLLSGSISGRYVLELIVSERQVRSLTESWI